MLELIVGIAIGIAIYHQLSWEQGSRRPPEERDRRAEVAKVCREAADKLDGGEKEGNDLGRQIDIWAHSGNIKLVVEFHNALLHGLHLFIEEVDRRSRETEDEIEKRHLKADKHILGNFMVQNLRNFTLVMHVSNFEEISYNVCKMEKEELGHGSSLRRFMPGWTSRLGKPVGDVKEWKILDDASEVRNCILHAHGLPKLVKENRREKLNGILEAEEIPLDSGRIAAPPDYLNKVTKAIITLVRYGSNG